MSTIGVLGTSMIDCSIKEQLESTTCNKVNYHFSHGGSMRNSVAHLANLQQPSIFISIFGNDAFADDLITSLRKQHIYVCDKRVDLPTPIFLTFQTTENYRCSSISSSFFFQEQDYLPTKQLSLCDLFLTDTKVPAILDKLQSYAPVIVHGVLPTSTTITGLVISRKDSHHTFEEVCALYPTVEFIVYTDEANPIQYRYKNEYYSYAFTPNDNLPTYGCGDAFCASFAQQYLEGDLHQAIIQAHEYTQTLTK